MRWMKCLYVASILLLWILGIIILILATVIRDDLSVMSLVTENTSVGNFYLEVFFPVIFPILITVACFIFIIGCIGYCGVFTSSQTLLGWFFFTLLVTFCVELSAGVWRIIEYDLNYNTSDISQLQKNIKFYTSQKNTPIWFRDAWTKIHQKFDCCGVESYKDLVAVDVEMLLSCCRVTRCTVLLLGTKGCGEDLLGYLSTSKYIKVMPYITGVMGIVQMLAMVLTLKLWLMLCLDTKKNREENYVQVATGCQYDENRFCQIETKENKSNGSVLLAHRTTNHDESVRTNSTHSSSPRTTSNGRGLFNQVACPVTGEDCVSKNQVPCSRRQCSHTFSWSGSQKRNRRADISERSVTGSEVNRQIGSLWSGPSTTPKTSCTCSIGRQCSIVNERTYNKTKSQTIQKKPCNCKAWCKEISCQKYNHDLNNCQVSSLPPKSGLNESTAGRSKVFVNRQTTPPVKETEPAESSISREKETQNNSFKREQSSANNMQSDLGCHNRTPLNTAVDILSATSTAAT